MAAVHCLEHAVVPRLHRQVQERHQFWNVAVRRDQAVGHVVGVAGGVADPGQTGQVGQFLDQPLQPASISVPPGIHILSEQRDFLRPGLDQPFCFGHQITERTRDFGTAGIGHHAIGAELVAAFLHRQERTRADFAAGRERVELGLGGHVGIDRAAARDGFSDHSGQAVVGLRADHHADTLGARRMISSPSACATQPATAISGAVPSSRRQPPDIRIDLVRRLLADVAGVEHHQIGVLTLQRWRDPLLRRAARPSARHRRRSSGSRSF